MEKRDFTWGVRHRDSGNSDFLPIDGSPNWAVKWQALKNLPVATFAGVDHKGNIYTLTLNTPTEEHPTLWSFDPEGRVRWTCSRVQPSLTSLAVTPEGDVFVADGTALYKFDCRGERLWQQPLSVEISALAFLPSGALLVPGIDASVRVYDPETGVPLTEPFQLPSASMTGGVLHNETPRRAGWVSQAFQRVGVDPDASIRVAKRFIGIGVAAKNVPAVHPKTGRVFLAAADASGEGGVFYGLDVVLENGTSGHCRLAFSQPIGPGCDSSPSISPDGTRVYCSDRHGRLYALGCEDGQVAWTLNLPGAASASASVADDGRICISLKKSIVCITDCGDCGKILWTNGFQDQAKEKGYRTTRINSVLCLTDRYVYGVGAYGWQLRHAMVPRCHFLFTIDRLRGELISELPLAFESLCTPSITADGTLLVPRKPMFWGRKLALQKWWNPLSWFQTPPSYYGLTAFKPVDTSS